MPGLTPGQVEKKITPLNQSGWLEDVVPEVGAICLCWSCESSREMNMPNNVNETQQLRDSMDAATKSFGAMSKCFQAIATEVANYSKRSLEDHTAAMEKLMTARSPEKAMEVQTEYVKSAYEAFVGQATKIAELYADLGKECYKPFVGIIKRSPRVDV